MPAASSALAKCPVRLRQYPRAGAPWCPWLKWAGRCGSLLMLAGLQEPDLNLQVQLLVALLESTIIQMRFVAQQHLRGAEARCWASACKVRPCRALNAACQLTRAERWQPVQELQARHLGSAISMQNILLLGFKLLGCLAARFKRLHASPVHAPLTVKVRSLL